MKTIIEATLLAAIVAVTVASLLPSQAKQDARIQAIKHTGLITNHVRDTEDNKPMAVLNHLLIEGETQ